MKEKKEENQFAERLFFYFALITPRLSNDVDYHIIDVSKSFSLSHSLTWALFICSLTHSHTSLSFHEYWQSLMEKSVVCDIFLHGLKLLFSFLNTRLWKYFRFMWFETDAHSSLKSSLHPAWNFTPICIVFLEIINFSSILINFLLKIPTQNIYSS